MKKRAPNASASSAGPSTATIQFVEEWLWDGDGRETIGGPWSAEYVRDAARMIEFMLIHRPTNTRPPLVAGMEENLK
jgi:hypothetical protein